ncbi:MAG: OmpA family protein [Burkholderiaceae bacterium]|jgi:OOP family OmpA-OmpF porin|nr:OmpA family protein [Burkholderiaceae bacterium]
MKKLNQVAMLVAIASVAGSAFANGSTISSDNWRNGYGNLIWKNGTHELCWRDAFWTPATAAPGCDGALAPAPKQQLHVTPPPAVTPPPKQAPTVEAQKITYAADAFFDFDKSVLKPAGRASLDELASKIQGINLEVIVATGHTDSVGSLTYNQRLSLRRAEAVKAYLVSKGIDKSRIYTEGKGKTQPIASNKTAAGRAKNRRVEIEVVGTAAAPQQAQ